MAIFANRYERIEHLGRGMSGSVYLVRDQKTGLKCAFKILKTSLISKSNTFFTSFQNEFNTLKNLNHPSIAKVFDAGFEEYETTSFGGKKKVFHITTEYIMGSDLLTATENEPLSTIENLFVQALRAINYLHSQHVFHFDIKPTNILVSKNENGIFVLKLIDFGLANFYNRPHEKKNPDSKIIAGTSPYVSPEIIKGEFPNGRSDLYSLGCAFFKAFTRELPFMGSSREEFHEKHLFEPPRVPSSINPEIPEYVDKILLKLLEKNPSNRYENAQKVMDDLNLLSTHFYLIETPETRISYVPEKGEMIGRKKELEKFNEIFNDRLILENFSKKPFLIIRGDEGSGKTRFVQECKHAAQKLFIQTMTWKELIAIPSAQDIKNPCLILADDEPLESDLFEYAEVFFENLPLLALFTTSQKDLICPEDHLIELNHFTRKETEEYLFKATGLPKIPKNIGDIIYRRTLGNPLFLTEYVKALFEQNFFKDAYGSWSEQVLEDLGSELEKVGATEFIKKGLKAKLDTLNFNDAQFHLLYMMAFCGKPTLIEIAEMSGSHDIEENLRFFVKAGILQPDLEHRYIFTNPLYKDVLLENIDPEIEAEICDLIGNYHEQHQSDLDLIYYYRGRGSGPKAEKCLLDLARKKREELLYTEAIDHLEFLLQKNQISDEITNRAHLELGEIKMDMGKYEDSAGHFKAVVHGCEENGDFKPSMVSLKALEQLGLSFYRRGCLEEAKGCYEKGLKSIQDRPTFKWFKVILQNRLALHELDNGHPDIAENIFLETWAIWKNELNEEEKIAALCNNIDSIYYLKGEYEKARFYLEEILTFLSKAPYTENYPLILYRLGRTYLQTGEEQKGEAYLQQCLETLKDRKTPQWLCTVYNELGNLEDRRKNYEKALAHYQHAFDLARKTRTGVSFFIIVFNIANIYSKLNHFAEAEKYYGFVLRHLPSLSVSDELNVGYHLYQSCIELAGVHRKQQRFEKAETLLHQAFVLLTEKKYLKLYEQYFWQEKALLANNENKEHELQEALTQLEETKKEGGFNFIQYQVWQTEYSQIGNIVNK